MAPTYGACYNKAPRKLEERFEVSMAPSPLVRKFSPESKVWMRDGVEINEESRAPFRYASYLGDLRIIPPFESFPDGEGERFFLFH